MSRPTSRCRSRRARSDDPRPDSFRRPEYLPAVTARYQRRLRKSARKAAVILANSENTRRDILELLDVPPEKVRTALLGVRPDAFLPPRRRRGSGGTAARWASRRRFCSVSGTYTGAKII